MKRTPWRARKLSAELNHSKNEHSVSCKRSRKPGARFIIREENKMKKSIISAIAIGLILCAAAWPQLEPSAEETPAEPTPPTVTATQTDTPELPEEEEPLTAEEEKDDAPQTETVHDTVIEQELTPAEEPTTSEKQPEPKPTPTPAPPQANAMPQVGDLVYVPGFGYLECQGPGEVTRSEAMYENGNKVGTMS